jgi:hypothetical protein
MRDSRYGTYTPFGYSVYETTMSIGVVKKATRSCYDYKFMSFYSRNAIHYANVYRQIFINQIINVQSHKIWK